MIPMKRCVRLCKLIFFSLGLWTMFLLVVFLSSPEPVQRVEIEPSVPDDVIHVMLTSAEDTLIGLMATINSIEQNTNTRVKYHILTEYRAVPHLRKWINESNLFGINYQVKAFNPNFVNEKIKLRHGRPELALPMNYARYFYPSLFPEVRGKFIHIDDDVIVQGDISELAAVDLRDDYLVAFSNDCNALTKEYPINHQNKFKDYLNFKSTHVTDSGAVPDHCSYNVGVFVGHMDRWRAAGVTKQLTKWLQLNTKEYIYGNEFGGGGSQPPMMLVFQSNYSHIDALWHVQYLGYTQSLQYAPELIESAKLLHWNGRTKPWDSAPMFAEHWDKYYIPDPYRQHKLARLPTMRFTLT